VVHTARRSEPPAATDRIPADRQAHPKDTWDTERDRTFARFLRDKAGAMIRQSTVGIDRKGRIRVELSKAVAPEDSLPLTKSIVQGARKDFPDKPFTLSVYDPQEQPILRAHYRPNQGVHYEVVHSDPGSARAKPEKGGAGPTSEIPPSGTTERDRRFAEWAMKKASRYLRYVQADLEHRGRLWFGVTREVRPDDVADLTKSLLEGAQQEFPRRELTATVFDPDGERIGRASLAPGGKVHWSR